MLRFDRVTVTAGSRTLLQTASFHLQAQDRIVLCGPSGAGKSTLLHTVIGIYPPSNGTIYFDGQPVSAATIAQVRARIAFIAQRPDMGADTVREALLLPFTFKAHRHRHPDSTRLREVLQRLNLDPAILDRPCRVLSGGELQRTAIARALLLDKTLFLLDEITAGLDHDSTRAVIDLFTASTATVLSVSHDPAWIAASTRVLLVENGRVRAAGPDTVRHYCRTDHHPGEEPANG